MNEQEEEVLTSARLHHSLRRATVCSCGDVLPYISDYVSSWFFLGFKKWEHCVNTDDRKQIFLF